MCTGEIPNTLLSRRLLCQFCRFRKKLGEVTELIPEDCISECTVEEITDVPVPQRRTRDSHAQGVRWKEAGIHNEGRVRSGW